MYSEDPETPPPSVTPTRYTASAGIQLSQTSPQRLGDIQNWHPGKSEGLLRPLAKLDRKLQPKHRRIIPIDCDEFMDDVLPKPEGVVPTLSQQVKASIQAELDGLFTTEDGEWVEQVLEDDLAEIMRDIINRYELCGDHVATLSRYGYNHIDASRAKVDAMIYPTAYAPTEERPDWTHARMFIEFKRGGTSYDPFDDDDEQHFEANAETRTGVRAQLYAYAYNCLLFQHRTAIYALLINGPEFRAMRYDYSGLIVTRKVNYIEDLDKFLGFLAVYGQLDAKGQGFDPTVTLLDPESEAYKVMDEYSEDPGTDLDYMEGTSIASYTPGPLPNAHNRPADGPQSASPAAAVWGPARGTRGQAKQAAARRRAIADTARQHDSDLDIEISDDGEDPRIFKYVRERYRDSLQGDWPRYKLEVGPEKRKFLVGKPIFCLVVLFGRGTRGYVALDAKSRRFVFLKDSWRPFYEKVAPEGYYLRLLEGGTHPGKAYVPRLLCHGDVADQATFASRYYAQKHPLPPSVDAQVAGDKPDGDEDLMPAEGHVIPTLRDGQTVKEDDDKPAFRDHMHYRIVTKDVCLPFESFTSAEQLVRCLSHCVIGHGYAYESHGLLHRDISSGNILILPTLVDAPELGVDMKIVIWCGVMTDWEVAKQVSKNEFSLEEARQPERTGTWQFMSVYYVEHKAELPVTVADELESFFHVLLFYAVRRLHHNIPNIPGFVTDYFDAHDIAGEKKANCSSRKRGLMKTGLLESNRGKNAVFYIKDNEVYERFHALIDGLLELFIARYDVLQHDAVQTPQPTIPARPQARSLPGASIPNTRVVGRAIRTRTPNPWQENIASEYSAGERRKAKSTLSEETRELARKLETHAAFYNVFARMLDPINTEFPPWPDDSSDIERDRLRGVYDPRPFMIAIDNIAAAGSPEFALAPSTGGTAAARRRGDGKPPRKRAKIGTTANTCNASDKELATNMPTTDPVVGSARGARRRGREPKGKHRARR